jgi:hypothetical protein
MIDLGIERVQVVSQKPPYPQVMLIFFVCGCDALRLPDGELFCCTVAPACRMWHSKHLDANYRRGDRSRHHD